MVYMPNIGDKTCFYISYVASLQVHTWSMDVNLFVADEDEGSYSCRISGKLSLNLFKSNSYAYA